MRTLIGKILTSINFRLITQPSDAIIRGMELWKCVCNVLIESLQIIVTGRPYYWKLEYKQRVSKEKRLIVLANGPSLNEDLERLSKEDTSNADFAMMNFSVNSPLFTKYKPKFYCLADNAFFFGNYLSDNVKSVYIKINEDVNWDMTLCVAQNIKSSQYYEILSNQKIHIQRIFPFVSHGPEKILNWLYKKGYAIPGMGTVTNMATYVGIQYGYKHIELCGNDMSFFDGICVNDDNVPCCKVKHFYDDKVELKCQMISKTKAHTLKSYVTMVLAMIISHDKIARYAKNMNIEVLNRTRKSMLDSYTRLIQVKPELFS